MDFFFSFFACLCFIDIMDDNSEFILIQHCSDQADSPAKEPTTTGMLTPLVSMAGHAASEQLDVVPTEASRPSFSGSNPTYSVALPKLNTLKTNSRVRTTQHHAVEHHAAGCNSIRQPLSSTITGPILAQGSPIRWLRHSSPNLSMIATPVSQLSDTRSVDMTKNFPESASQSQSDLFITGSTHDVTPNMAAPMLDKNTVASLHHALGIDSIVSSIKELSSIISDNTKEEDYVSPPKRRKLLEESSESITDGRVSEESEDEAEPDDSRFGNAFKKCKTSGTVNKTLAEMMNRAGTSSADSDFVKDIRDKYHRPSNVPFLLVPTVNSTIYKKMSRFNKDLDHGLQKTQGTLCSGIYAVSLIADKLHDLKKSNPDDEVLSDLLTTSEDATFLLSHASFLMSSSRREHLKHLFQGDYKELCKKTHELTDELFGSELSKACKDISEASRATTKMLKSNKNANSFRSQSRESFRSQPRDPFRSYKGKFNNQKQ